MSQNLLSLSLLRQQSLRNQKQNLSRRSFLRLLGLGVVGSVSGIELDIDRLLWVPSKTIFLPSPSLITESQTIATELERITPKIAMLFNRDDIFYKILKSKESVIVSSRKFTVPSTTGILKISFENNDDEI